MTDGFPDTEPQQFKQDKVKEIHAARCEEQGHEWENCCSVWFQIYQKCKWCNKIKR